MLDTNNFDPREIPIYSIPQAAQYLRLRKDRLRDWVGGWFSKTKADKRFFEPLIKLPNPKNFELLPQSKTTLLSFTNLVEAHVLIAIFKATGFSRNNLALNSTTSTIIFRLLNYTVELSFKSRE